MDKDYDTSIIGDEKFVQLHCPSIISKQLQLKQLINVFDYIDKRSKSPLYRKTITLNMPTLNEKVSEEKRNIHHPSPVFLIASSSFSPYSSSLLLLPSITISINQLASAISENVSGIIMRERIDMRRSQKDLKQLHTG